MFKRVLLVFLLFKALSCYAQEDSKLIYFVKGYDSITPLIPIIESKIKSLTNRNGQALFSQTFNLNSVNNNISIESQIKTLVENSELKERLTDSKKREELYNELSTLLKSYDKLLIINVTPINNLLEYQFWLYDVYPSDIDIPSIDNLNYKSSSTIINLDENDIEKRIEVGLKKVFNEANIPPRIIPLFNNQPISDTLLVFKNETVEINTQIYDPDNQSQDIKLSWLYEDSDSNTIIPIKSYSESQELKINKTGNFTLKIVANDGISQSDTSLIQIKAILPFSQENEFFYQGYNNELISGSSIVFDTQNRFGKRYVLRYPSWQFFFPYPNNVDIELEAVLKFQNDGLNQFSESVYLYEIDSVTKNRTPYIPLDIWVNHQFIMAYSLYNSDSFFGYENTSSSFIDTFFYSTVELPDKPLKVQINPYFKQRRLPSLDLRLSQRKRSKFYFDLNIRAGFRQDTLTNETKPASYALLSTSLQYDLSSDGLDRIRAKETDTYSTFTNKTQVGFGLGIIQSPTLGSYFFSEFEIRYEIRTPLLDMIPKAILRTIWNNNDYRFFESNRKIYTDLAIGLNLRLTFINELMPALDSDLGGLTITLGSFALTSPDPFLEIGVLLPIHLYNHIK